MPKSVPSFLEPVQRTNWDSFLGPFRKFKASTLASGPKRPKLKSALQPLLPTCLDVFSGHMCPTDPLLNIRKFHGTKTGFADCYDFSLGDDSSYVSVSVLISE